MKTGIAAAAVFAGSLLIIPIALESANAGHGSAEAAWAASMLVAVESAILVVATSVISMAATLVQWAAPILPMLAE